MSGRRSRKRKRSRQQRKPSSARVQSTRTPATSEGQRPGRTPEATPSRTWEQLRQGARNVAGVSYQIAVTADLLVQARTGQLRLGQLVPEGYEDIDCLYREGGRLYVQTKDVGGGGAAPSPRPTWPMR